MSEIKKIMDELREKIGVQNCGELCIYGLEVCCRDCDKRATCDAVCEGEDEAGCDKECSNRIEPQEG